MTVLISDLWYDEKAEAWEQGRGKLSLELWVARRSFLPSRGLRLSSKLLPIVTVADRMWVIRIVGRKLLPTAKVADRMWVIRIVGRKLLLTATVAVTKLLPNVRVGDKKCLICSVRSILPRPTRHDQKGGVS